MKTKIAILSVALAIISAALPASAGYVAPGADFATKAFTVGVP